MIIPPHPNIRLPTALLLSYSFTYHAQTHAYTQNSMGAGSLLVLANAIPKSQKLCPHGGKGDGGTSRESRINTHTLPHVKQVTSGKLPYSTGSSAQHSAMN